MGKETEHARTVYSGVIRKEAGTQLGRLRSTSTCGGLDRIGGKEPVHCRGP